MDEQSQQQDASARQEAQACLDGLQPSAVAQQAALQRVLDLSEQALNPRGSPEPASASPGSDAAAAAAAAADGRLRWLCARLRALQYLERLTTSLELHGGSWTPTAFAAMRDRTAAQVASALAAGGQLAALPLLLERHPRALAPSILDVLDCVPETVTAKQLAPLLRQVLALRQPPPLPRPADWVETAATTAALKEAGEFALLLATEPMAEASSGWRPPTQRQVAAWVCQRAQRIDSATGLLPNAISLLEAAQSALHYSEPSVGALLAAAQELMSLVKLAASREEGGAWRMDLQQYTALTPAQRLSLMLGQLGGDSLAGDLAQHVAPFLSRLGTTGTGGSEHEAAADPQLVLRQALEAEAARRLPWVVRLVQAEARQRSLFASAAQLARTAAACCYASEASDAWELLGSMLNAARDALRADRQLAREEREAAEAAVDVVRGHMTAARLLTKHGLTTTVGAVRDADRNAALRLLRTLLARVSRTKNTESRWVEVWMDLRSIQEHGLTQLSEEDIRTELCRALLRIGQYRLCKSYLAGLRPDAAEQLVLAAAREVFLSASGMSDRAVKQAKECLGLLPDSPAAQDQLASIRAAEQLQRVGLDLPPLQLQQLQARAAAGDGRVLEQLLEEHPQLAAADSGTLGQLAAALGIAEQQQPLLLRAAEAAHAAGDTQRAQGLLLMLAGQHFKPAWELAAAVAAEPGCSSSARQQLLVFALSTAPAEQLLSLLVRWQAEDSGGAGGCWELFSSEEAASSLSGPAERQQQQTWLEQRLPQCLTDLAAGGSEASLRGMDGEAAALGCLLALGPRGLTKWEQLLAEPRQPLAHEQRRRALLLGLTAAALLALQPADYDPAALASVVAAAEGRLAASPAELLALAQQHAAGAAGPGGIAGAAEGLSRASSQAAFSGEQSEAPSDGGEGGSGAGTPTPRTVIAAAAAKAAVAAAQRFHNLLLAAADAQHLQHLLPGVDAAAALAGGSESRRQLVLQLAAAAGKPPGLPAAAAKATASSPVSSPRPVRHAAASPVSSPPGSGGRRRLPLLRRSESSRKKVETAPPGMGGDESAADASAPSGSSGAAWRQLNAAAAGEKLQQALQLASKVGVPAWEVQLAFAESLLLHNQQHWQPGAAAPQLLESALPPLLANHQQAAALLCALLLTVWPSTTSRQGQHLRCVLHIIQRCCAAVLAGETSGSPASQQLPALAAACQAAEQLMKVAGGLDARLFLQPVVQLVAAQLGTAAQASQQPPAAGDALELNRQLFLHVTGSHAAQLAAAIGQLVQQFAAAAAAAGAEGSYPCSGSTVFLSLFCKSVARQLPKGGLSTAALQRCQVCLRHMAPADAAAAAAFAAAGGDCPLVLPASEQQLAAPSLPPAQQQQLLAAALDAVQRSQVAADASLLPVLQQLRRRHALLSACSSLGTACTGASSAQLRAAREAARALQQHALAGGEGTAGSHALDSCLQQLLTAGCSAVSVLQVAAVLLALQAQPEQAPAEPAALLTDPAAAASAQQEVATAADTAVAAALHAMSGGGTAPTAASQQQQQLLSAGDAVQNLFGLLRSLHQQPEPAAAPSEAGGEAEQAAALPADVLSAALDALRQQVWQQLQRKAAAYDGSGGAAETEAHLQVLELLGSVGTPSLWPGWQPPAADLSAAGGGTAAAAAGSAHRQALLFTRAASMLAVEWPDAVQLCRLSAADFADAQAAEVAVLRLVAAAERTEQLRLLLRLLGEVLLDDAFPAAQQPVGAGAVSADEPAAADEGAAGAAAEEQEAAPAGAVAEEEEAAGGAPEVAEAAVSPLHRAWAACLQSLLAQRDLRSVLATLDERAAQQAQQAQQTEQQQQQQLERQQGVIPALLLTQQEAEALLEAADASHGPAAAAAAALLLPYPALRRPRWQQLLLALGGSGSAADAAAGLPGLASLLILVVQQHPALTVELAGADPARQAQLQLLVSAALLQQQRVEGSGDLLGASCCLSLRMAVATAAAAELAAARQYTAAAWLAMDASATPRLLRVLDNGQRVLLRMLRSCATSSPAAAGAAGAAAELESGAADGSGQIETPFAAAALLRALPGRCSAALAQLEADLQVQL